MKFTVTIQDVSLEELYTLTSKLNGTSVSATPAPAPFVKEESPTPAASKRAAPAVDPARMAAHAASNPAKPPKAAPAAKPAAAKKNAAAAAEEALEDEEEQEAAPPPVKTVANVKAPVKRTPVPEPEEEEEEEAALPPKAKAKTQKAVPPPEEEEEQQEEEIAQELLDATKLKDVLVYLIDQGVNDPGDIKAECARLKNSVPLLSKINDLESRIDRTLEVMDMGDQIG